MGFVFILLIEGLVGVLSFGVGLVLAYWLFGKPRKPAYVKDHKVRARANEVEEQKEELEPVDGMNKFIIGMWPWIHRCCKAKIEASISNIAQSILPEYFQFKYLAIGMPPSISSFKFNETIMKEIVMDLVALWIGDPKIKLIVKSIPLMMVDFDTRVALHIRVTPMHDGYPMLTNMRVSILEEPHVDFRVKSLGTHTKRLKVKSLGTHTKRLKAAFICLSWVRWYVLRSIKKKSKVYMLPNFFEIPIVDTPKHMYDVAAKNPVGKLDITVVRGKDLMKKNSFVKLSLTGDNVPAKITSIKFGTLNPEWNEQLELIVKDPEVQFLHVEVFCENNDGSIAKIGWPYKLEVVKGMTPETTKYLALVPRGLLVFHQAYHPYLEDPPGVD